MPGFLHFDFSFASRCVFDVSFQIRGTVRKKSVPMASARLSLRCGSKHSRATTAGGTNISFQSVMKRGAVHLVNAALSEAQP